MIQGLLVAIMYYNYCVDYYPLDELKVVYDNMLNEKYECIEHNVNLIMPYIEYQFRDKIFEIKVGGKKYKFTPNMVKLEDGELYSINEVANMTEREFNKYLT